MMDKLISSTKNSSLVAIGLLALFVGFGAVGAIFEWLTWETLGDWTLKAVAISVVGVAVSAVIGAIIGAATPKK